MNAALLAGVGWFLNFDPQSMLTFAAAILLALITLFTSYDHIAIPGVQAALPLSQQLGIALLAAAVAFALCQAQLESNSLAEIAEIRVAAASDRTRVEAVAARERDRADRETFRSARRAQLQYRCAFVQLHHQLDPTPEHTRQLRGLIAFLLEFGECR